MGEADGEKEGCSKGIASRVNRSFSMANRLAALVKIKKGDNQDRPLVRSVFGKPFRL
jgi:hypothetical protein